MQCAGSAPAARFSTRSHGLPECPDGAVRTMKLETGFVHQAAAEPVAQRVRTDERRNNIELSTGPETARRTAGEPSLTAGYPLADHSAIEETVPNVQRSMSERRVGRIVRNHENGLAMGIEFKE